MERRQVLGRIGKLKHVSSVLVLQSIAHQQFILRDFEEEPTIQSVARKRLCSWRFIARPSL